jgi:hypothetical protein
MRCECPVCSKRFDVSGLDSESLLRCPHCSLAVRPVFVSDDEPLQVNGATVSSQLTPETTQGPPAHTRAEPVDEGHEMKEALPVAGLASDPLADPKVLAIAVRSLLTKELALREARELALRTRTRYSRLRWATVTAGALVPLAIGLAMVGALLGPGKQGRNAAGYIFLVTGCLLAVALVVVFLVRLAKDLSCPAPHERSSPEKGLHAFLGAMCKGDFEAACSCLVPDSEPTNARDLRQQWYALVKHSIEGGRGVRRYSLKSLQQSGDFALIQGEVAVPPRMGEFTRSALSSVSPLLSLLVTSGIRMAQVSKLLRRIDNLWYIVSAAQHGREDLFIDEAVRISELSDAALKEELGRHQGEEPK